MTIAAGARIGPYEIQAPLGAGGMGEVYVALDTRLRRKVAIKRLIGPAAQSAELRRRALREARAAAKLTHPSIAAVYDVLESDDALLIVMEYVEGRTLAERLGEGPLPLDESIRIVATAADALAAAHRAGVVHRDLKPANILLTGDGSVKLLDFGIAHVTEPASQLAGDEPTPTASTTRVEQLAGTPAYMPPERVLGRPVDHRGDIYSLGVVLFELLTGRRPFAAPDFLALLTHIATERAPSAHEIDPRVPREISAVVSRAMARDPSDRYATAEAFRKDLLVRGRPPGATTQVVPTPSVPSRLRRRLAFLIGALLVLALGAAAVIAWRVWRGDRTAAPTGSPPIAVAIMPLANYTPDSRNEYLGIGISDVLAAGLVTLPNVNVVSCTGAGECAGATRDARTTADRLGVSLIVSGGVQRVGDEINVSLQLEDAQKGRVVWAEQYRAPLAQLSSVQRRMRAELAAALTNDGGHGEASAVPPDAGTENVLALEQYSQARLLLERPDTTGYRAAITLLQSALEKDRGFALAHAALGQAYWRMYEETLDRQWTEQATKAVLEALRLDSSQPQVRLSLATIYHGTGELDKAAEEARRAIELKPHSDEAHRLLADILIERGDTTQAIEEVRIALQLRPRFWRNHHQQGYISYREGRFEEALAAFKQSISLQPDNARSHHMLGAVYLAMGKPEEALAPLTIANQIQPDARSLSNLGTVHYWAGRYDRAAAAYRQAIKLNPKEPAHHRNLGDALQRLGARRDAGQAYARAVEAAEELLDINPRNPKMRAMLAVYLAKVGNHRRAVAEIERALNMNRESGEVWYCMAVVEALAGDTDAALSALEQAINHGASRPVAAQDEDLASLKKDPRFGKLVAQNER